MGTLSMTWKPKGSITLSKAGNSPRSVKPRNAGKKGGSWKPPHGVSNDGKFAHLRSLNLLYDPGLELFMGNAVEHWGNDEWVARTGSNQFTLPVYDPTCDYGQRWPSGECVRYWDIAQWSQLGEPYEPGGANTKSAWIAERIDPYLGKFHLVWCKWDATSYHGGDGNPRPLMIQAPGLPPGYSARVEPGDISSWSIQTRIEGMRKKDSVPTCTMSLFYYDETGSTIVGFQETANLAMHDQNQYDDVPYEEMRVDATAPSGAYFMRAIAQFYEPEGWGVTGTLGVDLQDNFLPSLHVDSGVLSVW